MVAEPKLKNLKTASLNEDVYQCPPKPYSMPLMGITYDIFRTFGKKESPRLGLYNSFCEKR